MSTPVKLTSSAVAGLSGQLGFERFEVIDDTHVECVVTRRGVTTRTKCVLLIGLDTLFAIGDALGIEIADMRDVVPGEWDNPAWLKDDEGA